MLTRICSITDSTLEWNSSTAPGGNVFFNHLWGILYTLHSTIKFANFLSSLPWSFDPQTFHYLARVRIKEAYLLETWASGVRYRCRIVRFRCRVCRFQRFRWFMQGWTNLLDTLEARRRDSHLGKQYRNPISKGLTQSLAGVAEPNVFLTVSALSGLSISILMCEASTTLHMYCPDCILYSVPLFTFDRGNYFTSLDSVFAAGPIKR